jgi:hypothetical protein
MFTLQLSPNQLQLIGFALNELPKTVNALIADINMQLEAQQPKEPDNGSPVSETN